jgi:hypothetical protein
MEVKKLIFFSQLKTLAPNCGWLKNYKRLDDQFESLSKQFTV